MLPVLLSVPHLASAIGFAFLLAPAGWVARLASPWLTGWQRPPDLLTVNDPLGLALTLGLSLREAPFLLLAIASAQGQIATGRLLAIARTSGHGPAEAWLKLILPQLYRQIRLPLYAVLAFALSVVDMALVLGPAPPVLAVQVLRWLTDPDPSWHPVGAAGAVVQILLILVAIGSWRLMELAVARLARPWLTAGPSASLERWLLGRRPDRGRARCSASASPGLAAITCGRSRHLAFPGGLAAVVHAGQLALGDPGPAPAVVVTLVGGGLAAVIALVAVTACLEQESRTGAKPEAQVLALAYLPLLVPQISFLFGLQVLLVRLASMPRWRGWSGRTSPSCCPTPC